MKPAESWMEEMFGRLNWSVADTITLKAIQLDAYRAGMADALEIHQTMPPSEHYECRLAIKKARDNKTL